MLQLQRFAYLDDRTMGVLTHGDQQWWTVEKPWKDNQPFESCIPEGSYKMGRHDSPKFGKNTWHILEVPDRSYILIHAGNTPADVVGCIALGKSLRINADGVSSSRTALNELLAATEGLTEAEILITSGAISADLKKGSEDEQKEERPKVGKNRGRKIRPAEADTESPD